MQLDLTLYENSVTIDAAQAAIRQALDQLRAQPDHVLELRALNIPARYGAGFTASGWFDDMDAMAREAARLDAARGQVYVTLNPVLPALLCRGFNRVIERPKLTTSDRDILRRVWLPIDIDPIRATGISASPDEVELARQRAEEIVVWLSEQLGERPTLRGFSGNGFHLLYRVDLPNDETSTSWIKGVVDGAADKFSDERVNVDRTVFNAARIWRLYGTTNRKGDCVAKLGRVHRRAAILAEGMK